MLLDSGATDTPDKVRLKVRVMVRVRVRVRVRVKVRVMLSVAVSIRSGHTVTGAHGHCLLLLGVGESEGSDVQVFRRVFFVPPMSLRSGHIRCADAVI